MHLILSDSSGVRGVQVIQHVLFTAKAALLTVGVLLLELLFGDTLEYQPWRADFLSSDGQANDLTDFCVAIRWQERAQQEFGDELAEAIRRCIVCAFEEPDLRSKAFVQAVWTSVVGPVERFLSAWKGAFGMDDDPYDQSDY